MVKIIKQATIHNTPFWVFSAISVSIGVASFIIPPTGIIETSVLKFISWMFAFATLYVVMTSIKEGIDARLTKGDIMLEIGSLDGDRQNTIESADTEESEE